MTPLRLSHWDRAQLALLRMLSNVLWLADSLFGINWGERILGGMASRWQARLDELDESLAGLEEERGRLQSQAEALAIHVAAIYLGGRRLSTGELRFDPSDPHDERILDATIDLLVRERLAAIETHEAGEGRYIYHLEPDWLAIRARLQEAADGAAPEMVEWFSEGLRIIDETFLAGTGA